MSNEYKEWLRRLAEALHHHHGGFEQPSDYYTSLFTHGVRKIADEMRKHGFDQPEPPRRGPQ